MSARRVTIAGRVQGVGYREFLRRAANRRAVTGWTRNRADGSVEVVAEGDAQALADLEGRLREGPAFSEVSAVEREAIESRGDSGFQVR